MSGYALTPPAKSDVFDIWSYIARDHAPRAGDRLDACPHRGANVDACLTDARSVGLDFQVRGFYSSSGFQFEGKAEDLAVKLCRTCPLPPTARR